LVQGFLFKPIQREALVKELKKVLLFDHNLFPENINQFWKNSQDAVENNQQIMLELVNKLESEYLDQWKIIQQTKITSQIRKFAQNLEKEAIKYNHQTLLNYANTLIDDINNMELEILDEHLSTFNNLLKEILKNLEFRI